MPYFLFRSPFRTTPTINGKNIDLYLLYWLVTVQGGWEKVSQSAAAPNNQMIVLYHSLVIIMFELKFKIELKELTQFKKSEFLTRERDRESERQL